MSTLPGPWTHLHCIGHDATLSLFARSSSSEKHPHAWLFAGEAGVGKRTVMYQCARLILGEFSNFADMRRSLEKGSSLSQQIAQRSYPDLHVLGEDGPGNGPIPVERVRNFRAFLYETTFHGKDRVALIERIEALNTHGLNALLKVLEEPPPRTIFLLAASVAANTPATIRSRCQQIVLRGTDSGTFARALWSLAPRLLNNKAPPEKDMEMLYTITRGCIGKALRLLAEGNLASIQKLWEELDACRAGRGFGQGFFAMLDTLSTDTSLARDALLMWAHREMLTSPRSPESWAWSLARIAQLFHEADTFHLDKSAVLVEAIGTLTRDFSAPRNPHTRDVLHGIHAGSF